MKLFKWDVLTEEKTQKIISDAIIHQILSLNTEKVKQKTNENRRDKFVEKAELFFFLYLKRSTQVIWKNEMSTEIRLINVPFLSLSSLLLLFSFHIRIDRRIAECFRAT